MKRVLLIIATCLVMTGCGPSDKAKDTSEGKQFMEKFGECPDCGKRKINLFGGEK